MSRIFCNVAWHKGRQEDTFTRDTAAEIAEHSFNICTIFSLGYACRNVSTSTALQGKLEDFFYASSSSFLKPIEHKLITCFPLFPARTHVSYDIKGDVAVVRFNTPNSKVLFQLQCRGGTESAVISDQDHP